MEHEIADLIRLRWFGITKEAALAVARDILRIVEKERANKKADPIPPAS